MNLVKPVEETKAAYVRLQQIGVMAKGTPSMVAGNLFNSALMAIVFWGAVPSVFLLSWMALIWWTAGSRLYHWLRRRKFPPATQVSERALTRAATHSGLAGILWGSVGPLLFYQESQFQMIFLAFVLGGQAAAASTWLSPVLPAFYAYLLFSMVPLFSCFFLLGGGISLAMGSMLFVFTIVLLHFGRQNHLNFVQLVQVTFDNRELLKEQENALHDLDSKIQTSTAELLESNRKLAAEVNDRRRAEKELVENQLLMRTVIDTIPLRISLQDVHGKWLLINQALREQMGIQDPYEIPLSGSFPHLSPVENGEIASNRKRVLEHGESLDYERYRTMVDGSSEWVQAQWVPTRDLKGNISGLLIVTADITNRKINEIELTRFFDLSVDMHCITGLDGYFRRVNNAFTAVLGFDEEELLSKPFMALIHPDDQDKTEALIEGLKEGREALEFENRFRDIRGAYRLFSWRAAYDPELALIFAEARDITKLRKGEEELREYRYQLEEMVNERTGQLHQANQTLNESMRKLEESNLELDLANRGKNQFLSNMSHELRTPLNAIIGFADLLWGQYFGQLNEKQIEYSRQIGESGNHLLSLINDMLDIAKIDAGAMVLEPDSEDPGEVLQKTLGMMKTQFLNKDLKVVFSTMPLKKTFPIDSRKFTQILLNLLSNAVKLTPRKGRISVRMEEDADGRLKVEVSDSGIGIPKEHLEKIFSEFHQVDRKRDEHLGGTGIGLSLTRRLVELHQGNIGVRSSPEEGSTFWISLPQLATVIAAQEDTGQKLVLSPELRQRRIMVVEDDDVNLALLLDMLRIHDHSVIVARNGQEALDLALASKPEIILMDIRIPVMDGLTATRKLKKIAAFSAVPVIALTANASEEDIRLSHEAGMVGHLAKPINSDALFEMLNRRLNPVPE